MPTAVTLRTIATQCRIADDADALLAWLVEHADDVAAALGVSVPVLADAIERCHADGTLVAKVAAQCSTVARRERDAKRTGAAASMQAAVDASVTAGVIDARKLLAAITSAPPGSVLVCGDGAYRVPLAKLREVAALRRLRGAELAARVVPYGERGSAGGLRIEWTAPDGCRGRVTLHTAHAPTKDGWNAVHDADALALVLPA
jgi:hypothetical protein